MGSSRASGLVNAVLRRLAREWKQLELPSLETDPLEHLTHALSMPQWIAKRLLDLYGPEQAAAFAKASNQPAPITIRANRLRISRDELLERVHETDLDATPCSIAPDGIRLSHTGRDPGCDPDFREGLYTVQDEASQLIIGLLDPQPGEQILDTCAAPGTKTTGIAERLGDSGIVLALDRNARRLGLVSRAARRLSLPAIHVLHRDASKDLLDLPLSVENADIAGNRFDRILVDAPCSGLGTLRRNPDARWRIREGDSAHLAALQARLLQCAAAVLRPGGSLVYSTCTVLAEENELLIDRFLEQNPMLRQLGRNELPGHLAPLLGEDGTLRSTPQQHDTDGFFAVRLERSE